MLRARAYAFDFEGGKWTSTKLDFPSNGNVSIGGTNSKEDIAFINTESFLTPDTLWTIDSGTMESAATQISTSLV